MGQTPGKKLNEDVEGDEAQHHGGCRAFGDFDGTDGCNAGHENKSAAKRGGRATYAAGESGEVTEAVNRKAELSGMRRHGFVESPQRRPTP